MMDPLPKSHKNVFPFKIGTTSYIYPDHAVPNARMLGPFIDEIELLLFESRRESLPGENDIHALGLIKTEFDLSYNAHLPTDVDLSAPEDREHAVARIQRAIDLVRPINPSTHTLHLHCDINRTHGNIRNWRDAARKGVERLLEKGVPSKSVSIESLDYPFEWVAPIVAEFGLGICLDIGHLFRYGFDAKDIFDEYGKNTVILHIHGVENGRDHLPLNRLSEEHARDLLYILKRFTGVVSIEVFSYRYLCDSLAFLDSVLAV